MTRSLPSMSEPTLRPSDAENLAGQDTGREHCIRWHGHIKSNGYGQAHRSRSEAQALGLPTTTYAHRLTWERAYGPIPAGLDVHHRCGNRACVNLDHLELLSRRDHLREHAENRTVCKMGRHEWTEETIYVAPDGRRQCRECRREARERSDARKAAA